MGRRTHSTSRPYHHWDLMKILIILGAVVTIILAIIYMFKPDNSRDFFGGWNYLSAIVWVILWGIVHIILAIGLLSGTGAVHKPNLRIWCDWWILIIVGFLIVLPTGNWGGVIVIIAGFIGLFDRLD